MFYHSRPLAAALIQAVKEQPDNLKKITANFLLFLRQKKITSQLPKILEYLESNRKQTSQMEDLRVTSRYALSENELNHIKSYIHVPAHTTVNSIIDEKQLGGFIASYRGTIYDASIKNQLKQLKRSMEA